MQLINNFRLTGSVEVSTELLGHEGTLVCIKVHRRRKILEKWALTTLLSYTYANHH
jgi:hypothetical protein